MFFDTPQLSKDLQQSFSPQQGETLAKGLAQAGDDRLVTKADLSAQIAAPAAQLAKEQACFALIRSAGS